jgi:hypothetical protein
MDNQFQKLLASFNFAPVGCPDRVAAASRGGAFGRSAPNLDSQLLQEVLDAERHGTVRQLDVPSTGPPLAGPLCEASGGVYANVPLLYTCVFPDVFADHRVEEANNICTQSAGTFVDLPLSYSCVTLPAPAAGSRA